MNKTGDKILIRVLAVMDAIWLPLRRVDWVAPTPTVLYEHRKRYPTVGVPFGTGGGREDSRKNRQRELNELAAAGLLTIGGESRRVGVKLSEKAEIALRSLCGLPNLDEAHATLRRVISLEGGDQWPGPLCSELWLAGRGDYTDGIGEELWDAQNLLLPALCRQWIEGHSDWHGRVWYFATDAGRKIAALPAPKMPSELPEYSESANALYMKETLAARERLRRAKPQCPSELGYCPMSASLEIAHTRRERMRRRKAKNAE
ncbi:MAG: hypothetical protein L6306_10240 [Planctomycetales bacterium]|nr:hypothetical protein [Planctomycetales bacterium]